MQYGYINKCGDVIIKPQYDHAYPFSEGFAVVSNDNVFSIINTDNKVVYTLPEGYASYSSFKNGLSFQDICSCQISLSLFWFK